MLAIIRQHVDAIHKSFEKINVNEMIPCICVECMGNKEPYFYDFTYLKKCIHKNVYDVRCQNSINDISIIDLLKEIMVREQIKEIGGQQLHIQTKEVTFMRDVYKAENGGIINKDS